MNNVFGLDIGTRNVVVKEFARRISTKEEEAFFVGDGAGNLSVFSMPPEVEKLV